MNAFGVYLDRGELGKAMAAMEESIELERVGFIPPQATTRSELASVYANLGDLERANELVEIALRVVNELQPISRPWVMGTKAESPAGGRARAGEVDDRADPGRPAPGAIALRCGDPLEILRGRIAAAEGDSTVRWRSRPGSERLRRLGIRPFVPAALLLQGTSLAALGRWPEAERALREARSEAESIWGIAECCGRSSAS